MADGRVGTSNGAHSEVSEPPMSSLGCVNAAGVGETRHGSWCWWGKGKECKSTCRLGALPIRKGPCQHTATRWHPSPRGKLTTLKCMV